MSPPHHGGEGRDLPDDHPHQQSPQHRLEQQEESNFGSRDVPGTHGDQAERHRDQDQPESDEVHPVLGIGRGRDGGGQADEGRQPRAERHCRDHVELWTRPEDDQRPAQRGRRDETGQRTGQVALGQGPEHDDRGGDRSPPRSPAMYASALARGSTTRVSSPANSGLRLIRRKVFATEVCVIE